MSVITTTVTVDQNVVTLINVFTVLPERQQELVDLLASVTDEVMVGIAGFVSANIHASLDGTKVVNYAQWASEEHFEAMLQSPVAGEHMAKASAIADAEPHLYCVASVHHI